MRLGEMLRHQNLMHQKSTSFHEFCPRKALRCVHCLGRNAARLSYFFFFDNAQILKVE